MKVLAVSVILYITNMVSTNFFSLYVTQWLGIESRYPGLLPDSERGCNVDFMIGIQHKLELVKFRIPMWVGLALYAIAVILLILAPIGKICCLSLFMYSLWQ